MKNQITFEKWLNEQLTQVDQPYMTIEEFMEYLAQENIPLEKAAILTGCNPEDLQHADYIHVCDCTTFYQTNLEDLRFTYDELVSLGEI